MKDVYKKAKDLFEKELDKVVAGGSMTASNLELTYKIVDIIKDINEICEADDAMYDEEYSGRRGYGMRTSRSYGYGYPYMGNYTVEGSYGRGYSGMDGGYGMNNSNNYGNRSSGNTAMRSKLQQLLNEAQTDHERAMIQSWMDELMG